MEVDRTVSLNLIKVDYFSTAISEVDSFQRAFVKGFTRESLFNEQDI